jgi:hypothetical protein
MEVHAHSHTPRKKWTHYFWEFLMLFLAVFCGFLAENQREHMVEHQREKTYMNNLLQDLKRDTAALAYEIKLRNQRRLYADSLISEIDLPETGELLTSLYHHAYSLTSIRIFGYSNTTIQQLKNSGSMRLIRNKEVADSINAYDILVSRYKIREDVEREIIAEFRKAICYILDASVMVNMGENLNSVNYNTGLVTIIQRPAFTRPLLTKDHNTINLVKGLAANLHTRNQANNNNLVQMLVKAKSTIEILKKEYHLE